MADRAAIEAAVLDHVQWCHAATHRLNDLARYARQGDVRPEDVAEIAQTLASAIARQSAALEIVTFMGQRLPAFREPGDEAG